MKNNTSDSIFPFIKFHGSLVPISFAFSMDHQRVMACMEEPHGENQRANWIGTRFWPFLGTLGSGEKVKSMVLTDGFSCMLHCAQNAAGGMREFSARAGKTFRHMRGFLGPFRKGCRTKIMG